VLHQSQAGTRQFCIAVLEAMAAGCRIVTSRRAALPETTAGFARLVPPDDDRPTFVDHFVEEMVQATSDLNSSETDDRLRKHIAHVHQNHTWSGLATTWAEWIGLVRKYSTT
jgi:glycosyltransferase involved in cell wall biosynthesis